MRPEFSPTMSVTEFKRHYWYATELREICRKLGLDCIGTKAELTSRVEHFLSGDVDFSSEEEELRISMTDTTLGLVVSPDTDSYAELSTKVIGGFSFNTNWRAFCGRVVGEPNFKFTKEMAMVSSKSHLKTEGLRAIVHRFPIINTSERPYLKWLTSGKKTAEGRVNGPSYRRMKKGEQIVFFDRTKNQSILGIISFKHEYKTFKEMLVSEGVSNMLPFLKQTDLEQAIQVYESFPGAQRVKELGCVAIGIEVIEAKL